MLFLDEPDDHPRVADYLGGGHVDGALLFPLRPDDRLPEMIDRLGLPAVFGGRPLLRDGDTVHGHPYVDGDNRGGARQAVQHLVSLGRRRIAAVAGPYDQENSAADRLAGYRDVLPAAPAGLVEKADYTRQGGADAMAVLLDRHPDLDAVFVASDFMASGVLQTLRERGRRVPDDVAVVGFGGRPHPPGAPAVRLNRAAPPGGLTPRPHFVHHVGSHSRARTGNRYDEPMVSHDVSEKTPGALLVARLHVDLCRLASAIC
jgi:DNA-binding LacI/PurR family transcriptional regulator